MRTVVKLTADGPSFSYEKLVRETWYKTFAYKSHTEPSKFLVRETYKDGKDFKFYFFFWIAILNQQNGQRDEKRNN